jgi:hypothetical protein
MWKVIIANRKGGCAKTEYSFHLAARARERGMRVLAIDTDPQGDLIKRSTGASRVVPEQVYQWPPEVKAGEPAPMTLLSAPGYRGTLHVEHNFDLVVVDTAPKLELPDFTKCSLVIVPVNDQEALTNSVEVVQAASQAGKPVVLAWNRTDAGGKIFERELLAGADCFPKDVRKDFPRVREGASLVRSTTTALPAWLDQWGSTSGPAGDMLQFCDAVIDMFQKRHGA